MLFRSGHLIIFVLGLLLVLGVSQARAALLAFIFISVYLLFVARDKKINDKIFLAIFVILVIVVLYSFSGIVIEGEKGSLSVTYFEDAFKSIFFESDVDTLAGSRNDRLYWWSDIIDRVSTSSLTLLFGLGLNTILIDHFLGGLEVVLRYPHNSYVTILGFFGIIGLILYCIILFYPVYFIQKKSRESESHDLLKWYPVFFIGYSISAFFSTVFEAPFHSFVFWVVTGVVYRVANEPVENCYE